MPQNQVKNRQWKGNPVRLRMPFCFIELYLTAITGATV